MLEAHARRIIARALTLYMHHPPTAYPAFLVSAVVSDLETLRDAFEQEMWIPITRDLPSPDQSRELLLSNGTYVCRGYYLYSWDGTDPHFEVDGEGFRLPDVTHYRLPPAPPRS